MRVLIVPSVNLRKLILSKRLTNCFYIQEHKAEYKEGAAKEMIIEIIDATMPVDPEAARGYREKTDCVVGNLIRGSLAITLCRVCDVLISSRRFDMPRV